MFKLLKILFILNFYARVGMLTKIISIWKRYFWKKRILMLTFNIDYHNCQKCVP